MFMLKVLVTKAAMFIGVLLSLALCLAEFGVGYDQTVNPANVREQINQRFERRSIAGDALANV